MDESMYYSIVDYERYYVIQLLGIVDHFVIYDDEINYDRYLRCVHYKIIEKLGYVYRSGLQNTRWVDRELVNGCMETHSLRLNRGSYDGRIVRD